MSIKAKLLKNSTIELTASLDKSKVYGKKDIVSTPSPMINVALSGEVDGGITSGLTAIAGPSRHFKTNFSLFIASTYLKKYPDAVLLFYDSEFGSPQGYFIASGISPDRVIHTPIVNIEELRHDIINQIKAIGREDKVIIIIDSIGNLASKKEMDDAESGNAAEDMTRARKLKSLFRQITPYLTLNDIPMIIVNHTYQTMEMYSKAVMSGGTGPMLAADTVWILGRAQEKDKDKNISGYKFTINIEKSRFVKEKSKLPIMVSYEAGILNYSGLLDVALDGGYVIKPKNGWYAKTNPEDQESEKSYKEDDIQNNKAFWDNMFETTDFAEYIKYTYKLPERVTTDEETETELKEMLDK